MMSHRLSIQLQNHTYPITVSNAVAPPLGTLLASLSEHNKSYALVTDQNVINAHSQCFQTYFKNTPTLVLPPGETTKSLATLETVYTFLIDHHLDRSSSLFVIGGGVVGDLAGFAAATFLRGIDYYQIPTTLLAMVDSSVGGKTAVNLPLGKNLIGAFHHPKAVFISTEFLKTLPSREFSAGMAEVIKYALLGIPALFQELSQSPSLTPQSSSLPSIIQRCCQFKASIVQDDEREHNADGGRMLLNLGHTFAHALESVTHYQEYLHGEAVAIGLAIAARLSQNQGYLASDDFTQITALLAQYKLPISLKTSLPVDSLLAAMQRDKKAKVNSLPLIALKSLGTPCVITNTVPAALKKLWLDFGAMQ